MQPSEEGSHVEWVRAVIMNSVFSRCSRGQQSARGGSGDAVDSAMADVPQGSVGQGGMGGTSLRVLRFGLSAETDRV